MELQENKVLLVDDTDNIRKALKDALTGEGFSVIDKKFPLEAFNLVRDNPLQFEFAFIDHVFDIPLNSLEQIPEEKISDGVELAKKVSSVNPHIGIIVYSANPDITEKDQWEALAAGAHRYIYKGELIKTAKEDFVREIRELRQLKEALIDFHKRRRQVSSVLKGLRVGIDLIDKNYKVWFTNDEFDEIAGDSGHPHKFCSARFHKRPYPPCAGCLVKQAFEGKKGDRIFYSPVYPERRLTFKYLDVWAEPVRDVKGENIIATVESIIDITNSERIRNIDIYEHLGIIARSVKELGYNHVRICRTEQDADDSIHIRGLVQRGEFAGDFTNFQLKFKKEVPAKRGDDGSIIVARYIEQLEKYVDLPLYKGTLGLTNQSVSIALFNKLGNFVGWMYVDKGEDVGDKDFQSIKPYAREIAHILETKTTRGPSKTAKFTGERVIGKIRKGLAGIKNPQAVLETIIKILMDQMKINGAHIRIVKEKGGAELIAYQGEYGKYAARTLTFDNFHSLSIQVVATGNCRIVNNVKKDKLFSGAIEQMPEKAAEMVSKMGSLASFPLVLEEEVLGILGIQSKEKEFFDEDKITLFSQVARYAALALHDYRLAKERKRQATEEAWRTVAATAAHRIGNILPIAQNRLLELKRIYSQDAKISGGCKLALDSINRTFTIIKEFKEFARGEELSLNEREVSDVVKELAEKCALQFPDIVIEARIIEEPITINVNMEKLCDIFVSFIVDSQQFSKPGIELKICIATETVPQDEKTRKGAVKLIYSDNGKGVPEKLKKKIFEPFFTTSAKGSGIGLAYAREVIIAHNGTIKETGKDGQGVRFEITLPILKEED